ncbi:MAG: DUF2059 domain-containing protein [Daejeonella sp.]
MKKLFFLILLTGFCSNSFSQTSSKADNIRKILESTGVADQGIIAMQNMFQSYKTSMPDVPTEFWDNVSKEFTANSLIELIVPIYEKYYSEEDIRQLAEFYQSPLGKKIISTLPNVTADSMKAGQEWGKSIAEKIMLKLQNEKFEEDLKQ